VPGSGLKNDFERVRPFLIRGEWCTCRQARVINNRPPECASDIRENTYEHYQAVRDGSAWICSAVRQYIGPAANVPAAAPVTITATTNRHPDCSAIRPAPAPITAISISIHSLHNEMRYAGHELPECVCPRRTCRRQSVLQSDLQQPTTGVQAILRAMKRGETPVWERVPFEGGAKRLLMPPHPPPGGGEGVCTGPSWQNKKEKQKTSWIFCLSLSNLL
jgi:hypothetical protein